MASPASERPLPYNFFDLERLLEQKEIQETRYWLRLITEAKIIDPTAMSLLIQEAAELCNILGAIVSRAKQNT
jgi:hypothetical protein